MDALTKFDFITQPFELRVSGKQRFNNILGFSLSIFSCLMTFGLFFYLGIDMYQRKNPRVLSKKVNDITQIAEKDLSSDNFIFAFVTENSLGTYERPDLFYLQLDYEELYMDPDSGESKLNKKIKVPYNKCTRDRVPSQKLWDSFNFERFNCPDLEGLKLGGNWDQEYNYYFRLRLYHCSYAEEPHPDCNTDETAVREAIGNEFFLSTVFQEYYLDAEQDENPFQVKPVYSYFLVDYEIFKKRYVYFIEGLFRDDRGWIGTDFQYDSLLTANREFQTFSQQQDVALEDKKFYELTVLHIKGQEFFLRSFMKIPELLALIGGFNSIILLFFRLVVRNFVALYYPIKLVKELFVYNPTSEGETMRVDDPSLRIRFASVESSGAVIRKKISRREKPRINKREEFKELSVIAMLWRLVGCGKKQTNYLKLVEMGDEFIKRKIDIYYIVKWALKVEFFMSLVLEKEQYRALELIGRPVLNSRTNFLSEILGVNRRSEEERKRSKECLRRKILQGAGTNVDEKILEML